MDLLLAATEHHSDPGLMPFIIGGIFGAVFLILGIVTHSYRDVANRHSHKFENSTQNTSGHH